MFPGRREPVWTETRDLSRLIFHKLVLHARGLSMTDLRHEVVMFPSALASLLGRIIHR
jgi:hypothetical protein